MRILLVEDDPAIRAIVSEFFTRSGYDVDALGTGWQALDQVRQATAPYDVALVDWQLPGVNGREVAQALARRSPRTRLLILTGHPSDRQIYQATAKMGADLVSKPFTLRQLHAQVQVALRGAGGGPGSGPGNGQITPPPAA